MGIIGDRSRVVCIRLLKKIKRRGLKPLLKNISTSALTQELKLSAESNKSNIQVHLDYREKRVPCDSNQIPHTRDTAYETLHTHFL